MRIPTVAHTPWVHKNILIPTGLLDKVIDMFKEKITASVYEPSNASYQSHWFCVPKKNGPLQLIHNLQPLNAVTIRNAAVPPLVDQFMEGIAAHSCYSMLDLLVGYDHQTLDIASRDLTSFQSPLGPFATQHFHKVQQTLWLSFTVMLPSFSSLKSQMLLSHS